MDLHTLFKYSAANREDYKDIQIEFELPKHAFQQPRSLMIKSWACNKENS